MAVKFFKLFNKHKQSLLYGISLALLLLLLKWLELKLIIVDYAFEMYIGAIALFFTALGIWLALKLTNPKVETLIIEKAVYKSNQEEFVVNVNELTKLNLTTREVEVLGLMAQGLSNREIAEKLFVSLNTIKTHSSKIFDKMDVKRRTQAVELAQRLGILP